MKRILGIILAVLSSIAFLASLVWLGVAKKGLTLEASILAVLLSVVLAAVIFGMTYLILWLLY